MRFIFLLLACLLFLLVALLGIFIMPLSGVFPRLNEGAQQALLMGRDLTPQESNVLDAPRVEVRLSRAKQMSAVPPVASLLLDDDALSELFVGETEWTPIQLSVLLQRLHSFGFRILGFSSPLDWDVDEGSTSMRSLRQSLDLFEKRVMGLRLRVSPSPQYPLAVMDGTELLRQHVKGNTANLMVANQGLPQLSRMSKGTFAPVWAADWVMDEPMIQHPSSQRSVPLVLRWGRDVYPTMPLLLAMQHLGLKQKDVQLVIGEYIQLGETRFPIDAQGRISLLGSEYRRLRPQDVLERERMPSQGVGCSTVIVEHARALPDGHERVESIARALSLLTAPTNVQQEQVAKEQEAENVGVSSLAWLTPTPLWLSILLLTFSLVLLLLALLYCSLLRRLKRGWIILPVLLVLCLLQLVSVQLGYAVAVLNYLAAWLVFALCAMLCPERYSQRRVTFRKN